KLREGLSAKGGKVLPKWEPVLIDGLRRRARTATKKACVEALRSTHYLFPSTIEHARELVDRLKHEDTNAVLDIHEMPRLSGPSHVGAMQAASIVTPEFPGSRQFHLDPAPNGINTRYAWQFTGGAG